MSDPSAPTSPPLDDLVGSTINGKYRVLEAVAEGGMGKIYRAEQLPLGRAVAIKVLHQSHTLRSNDPSFQKRFFLEASLLSRLSHPNIVTVFDFGRVEGLDDAFFMAMEWLDGVTLSARLRERGRLPPQDAMRIVREMARGLREAHKQNLVHRDLKPGNVMLLPEEGGGELVKILDFGLVKVVAGEEEGREHLTRDNSLLGSPRYMAPEQISQLDVDARTDIYALGAILYALLTGRPPFDEGNALQILTAHLHSPPPPLSERVPDVAFPRELEELVRRCLEKDREARPASCEELLRELRLVSRALGWTSSEDSASHSGFVAVPLPETRTPDRSNPTVAVSRQPLPPVRPGATAPATAPAPSKTPWIAGGVVALLLLGGGAFALRTPSEPAPVAAPIAAAPAPPPAPVPAQPPAPPAEAERFPLLLESVPPGAEVYEGEAKLGQTPLQLSLENREVRERPRTFVFRLEGHEPYTVVQGPSREAVRLAATLVPSRAAPADPARPTTPKPKPKPKSNDSDILLVR